MQKRLQALLVAGALVLGIAIGAAAQKQPHMREALETLHTAERQLQQAEHDKGGHRDKALEDVRAAINEVKEGIAYADHH